MSGLLQNAAATRAEMEEEEGLKFNRGLFLYISFSPNVLSTDVSPGRPNSGRGGYRELDLQHADVQYLPATQERLSIGEIIREIHTYLH